jgi:hypothetical protein
MIFGLCMQAIFGFALSGAYNKLVPGHIAGFAVMYGIFLAFGVSVSFENTLDFADCDRKSGPVVSTEDDIQGPD